MKGTDIFLTVAGFSILSLLAGISIGTSRHDDTERIVVQKDTVYKYPDINERSLLVLSMMWVESKFNPLAEGSSHDTGILQITPVYVREVNRILGEERYTITDAYDVKSSLDMFDTLQGHYNPDGGFANTIYYHNKSDAYMDKVVKAYNMFLSYERMRQTVSKRY